MSSRLSSYWSMAAITAAALLAATVFAIQPVQAAKAPVFTGLVKGVAVGGYDPVGYFTQGKPVRGSKDLTHKHDGATWRFSSNENLEAFRADPAKYAPRYGGYCAWAVSKGYTAKGDPNAWKIVDGRLYLNYNKSVQKTWLKNTAGNIKKADANWPTVLSK